MLSLFYTLRELDFSMLMQIYAEGNRENGADLYFKEPASVQVMLAEQDFYCYLRDIFFSSKGAFYAVWVENGRYISALRVEPYQDGLLLEALETVPEERRRGFARKLVSAVLEHISREVKSPVYSHIRKSNAASLRVHEICGFERVLEYAVYIDGSVTQRSCTMKFG